MSNRDTIVQECWEASRVVAETPLAGDASTRRYLRLHLSGGEAPPTAIAMLLPEPTRAGAPELPFLDVHRHLESRGVSVPTVYAARDRDLGVILLEDLGDRSLAGTLLDPATTDGQARRLLAGVVDLLALLVASEPTAGCVAYRRSHDEALVRRELDLVLAYGLADSDDGPARPVSTAPEARAALERLGGALVAQPRRFMHRDFHAWNLLVDRTGRLHVIDFQDAMLGPPAYDLASLCTDRDSDRFVDAARERDLLDGYRAALARRGVDLYRDPDVLARDYYAAVAFRTLRVIGRFRQLAIERGDRRYLQYLPRMARQTRRALDALGDASLARILAAHSAYFA